MGRPELATDSCFANRDSRVANATALEAMINQWSRKLSVAAVVAALEAEGVPVAPVRHPEDALLDPRVVARHEAVPVSHPTYESNIDLRTAGIPIVFSDAKTGFEDVLPIAIGQHNDRVFSQIAGYSPERIAELRRKGVI
jgi:crotonobetainyl-CoA:carnitine CoA-transferase CaiB-like acyl-CoA transferase